MPESTGTGITCVSCVPRRQKTLEVLQPTDLSRAGNRNANTIEAERERRTRGDSGTGQGEHNPDVAARRMFPGRLDVVRRLAYLFVWQGSKDRPATRSGPGP